MPDPRVRFAPSPTGHLHVGGARTALFNWLFARSEGGTFVLRIEDTDRERSSPQMTRSILDALEWLGIDVDEGPHHQADGGERHRAVGGRLLETGAAYRCFCASGRPVEEEAVGGCPGGCRRLETGEAERRAEGGDEHAVRFRVPDTGSVAWDDVVHGPTSFENASVEDFVLLRSDGTPTYNLACVADDLGMRITHVIRGADHISNTPKQILLYRALGEELPAFAHVPLILGADGKRLSKRHGAVSVDAYREKGVLPEAMVNFLALLGWSPGDGREVMGREELVEAFSLDRVVRKSAAFDTEKLEWLNGQHIKASPAERLARVVGPRLVEEEGVDADLLEEERDRFLAVLDAVKDRPRTVDALVQQVRPFVAEEVEYEPEAVERFWSRPEEAAGYLRALGEALREADRWEAGVLEERLRGLADELGVGAGKLIHPLRVAVTGLAVSPGIFAVLELMGRARCLERIGAAAERLAERAGSAP